MMDFSGIKELTIGDIALKELSIDEVKVWQSGRLPAGYTEVEWIETDGNGYIDTGINCSDHDAGIGYYFKGSISEYTSASGNNYLWGCFLNGARAGNPTINTSAKKIYVVAGSVASQALSTSTVYVPSAGAMFECWIEIGCAHIEDCNGRFKGESMEFTFNQTADAVSGKYNIAMPNGNVYLGWVNGLASATKYKGRWYAYQMYDVATGEMLRDYVPAISRDGDVGLYDLVSNAFFTNAGTGSFGAGGAV